MTTVVFCAKCNITSENNKNNSYLVHFNELIHSDIKAN